MQFELFGDRYQLQDPIDRDGMSVVYRALDLRTDHIVAIKVLRDIYSTDAKFVARFQREAKAMSSLQHPNIVQFYDYGQAAGNYYIVMELVEAPTCAAICVGAGCSMWIAPSSSLTMLHLDWVLPIGGALSIGLSSHRIY